MIQVDRQTRSTIMGLVVILLASGWIAFGLLGHGNIVFLTIMLILTIVLGSGAIFFVQRRANS